MSRAVTAGLPYPAADEPVTRDLLARLDELNPCSEHWKILITAGMGFFADAYDLFIIGVAAALITSEWQRCASRDRRREVTQGPAGRPPPKRTKWDATEIHRQSHFGH